MSGGSLTGVTVMVATSTSDNGPPKPVLPLSSTVIVNGTVPLKSAPGMKRGAVSLRNVLSCERVPDNVSADVPLPDTVTPLPFDPVSTPDVTDNVTVIVPLPASMSATESPDNVTRVSSAVVHPDGSVFTGASFTAPTVTFTVPVSVPPPAATV